MVDSPYLSVVDGGVQRGVGLPPPPVEVLVSKATTMTARGREEQLCECVLTNMFSVWWRSLT